MTGKLRCFISIPLPEGVIGDIKAFQERLKGSGVHASWTRPEGLHLTLKFLGEIGENRVEGIKGALDMSVSGFEPFPIFLYGAGVFPGMRRPRVIWIGIREEGDNLLRLYNGIEKAMEGIGFPPEDRRFTPHITLGRIKSRDGIERLVKLVDDARDIDIGRFVVLKVQLMKSQLRPEGSIYTELYAAFLKNKRV